MAYKTFASSAAANQSYGFADCTLNDVRLTKSLQEMCVFEETNELIRLYEI